MGPPVCNDKRSALDVGALGGRNDRPGSCYPSYPTIKIMRNNLQTWRKCRMLGCMIRALSYARVTQPSPRHFLHVCNLFVQGWPREMALSSENWNRNVWYWMIGLCIGRSLGAGIFKQGTFLLTISVCRPGLAERNSGRGIGGPSSKKTMMMTSRRKLNGLLRLFRHSHFMI